MNAEKLDGALAVQAIQRWKLDFDVRSRYSSALQYYEALIIERELETNPSAVVIEARRRLSVDRNTQ